MLKIKFLTMKLSNLSSLNENYVKRIGLIFASIFIVMEIVAHITGVIEKLDVQNINIYLLLSLSLAAFSKEKIDDERLKAIRYFSLKLTFNLLIVSLAINYLLKSNIETIYIAISSLIIYLIVFNLANHFNPEFIFKEETKTNKKNIKFLVGIMIFIGIGFLYNIIRALISS